MRKLTSVDPNPALAVKNLLDIQIVNRSALFIGANASVTEKIQQALLAACLQVMSRSVFRGPSSSFCSTSCGFDPTPHLANRWWYWRQGRSAFGRFEEDEEGLFFMRGQQPSASQARKRARAAADASATELLENGED